MIESPYVIASRIAFLRSFVRLRKKLTVIGIIGHTQGVSKAINPPRKPAKKMNNQDVSVAETVVSPNAFNWSMTGVQRAASSVSSLEARTGLFSALFQYPAARLSHRLVRLPVFRPLFRRLSSLYSFCRTKN